MFDDKIKIMTTAAALAIGGVSLGESSTSSTGEVIIGEEDLAYYEAKNSEIDTESFNERPKIVDLLLRRTPNEIIDAKFFRLVQSFAVDQIDLGPDFKEALLELAIRSGKKDFTKRRF